MSFMKKIYVMKKYSTQLVVLLGLFLSLYLLNSLKLPDVPGCKPRTKMAFLKTFKCGTTTLGYMLVSFVEKHNLINQDVDQNKLRTGPFNRTFLVDLSVKGDLLYDHFIWNRDEVVAQMGPNVTSFTIIRNPYDVFESLYSFMNLTIHLQMDYKGFIQLLRENDPINWKNTYTSSNSSFAHIMLGIYSFSTANSFGLPIESMQDDVEIDNYIIKIEKEFDLVMITERMEESMILFGYLMCWKPEDIVVFDHHVRSPDKVAQLNDDDKKELSRWLKADLKIYKHFYKVFEERVASYPGDMNREIQQRIIDREKRREECYASPNDSLGCIGFNLTLAKLRKNPF